MLRTERCLLLGREGCRIAPFGCHPALQLSRRRIPAPPKALIPREPLQQLLEEFPSSSNAPGGVLPPAQPNSAGAWLLPIPCGLGRMGREGRAATAAGSIWPSCPDLARGLAVLWESLARVSLSRSTAAHQRSHAAANAASKHSSTKLLSC